MQALSLPACCNDIANQAPLACQLSIQEELEPVLALLGKGHAPKGQNAPTDLRHIHKHDLTLDLGNGLVILLNIHQFNIDVDLAVAIRQLGEECHGVVRRRVLGRINRLENIQDARPARALVQDHTIANLYRQNDRRHSGHGRKVPEMVSI